MDILKKFNAIGSTQSTPIKKLKELEIYYEYSVTKIKQISTKNGNKFVSFVVDSDWNDLLIFLPDRFNENITGKEIRQLNKLSDSKFVYRGTKDCEKGNPAPIVEFLT